MDSRLHTCSAGSPAGSSSTPNTGHSCCVASAAYCLATTSRRPAPPPPLPSASPSPSASAPPPPFSFSLSSSLAAATETAFLPRDTQSLSCGRRVDCFCLAARAPHVGSPLVRVTKLANPKAHPSGRYTTAVPRCSYMVVVKARTAAMRSSTWWATLVSSRTTHCVSTDSAQSLTSAIQ